MLILAVESSCDETAVALVRDGRELVTDQVFSQADLHAVYGGVVPEIASRSHVEVIYQLAERALQVAGLERKDIDAVAVTYAPGLIGALLVGVNFAKAAALALDVGSKLWAVRSLEQAVTVLPGILELRLSRNNGMALGLLSGNWLANLLLPLAVIVAGWLLMRRYCPTVFTRVAAGLIVGGFLGNFGERLLFGSVVDMLYFPWLPWFICNVADIAICFGVAMLVISTLLRPQDWRERRENDSAAGGN